MSKIFKGILGGFSGLIGNVVGSNYRGMDIMKTRPKKSSKPAVQSVVDQRTKFGLVTTFLGPISTVINSAFAPKSQYLSPMNSAVQYNLDFAITGTSPLFVIEHSKVRLANGKLNGIDVLSAAPVAGNKLTITWNIADDSGMDPEEKLIRDKDTLRVITYCENTGGYYISGYTTLRSAGTFTTRVPNAEEGDSFHTWVVLISANKKSASTSQYLGEMVVLSN